MTFINDGEKFSAQVQESWNFLTNGKLSREDIAVFMELITRKGGNKEPIESMIMALVSMFASVDGLYEMFKKRLEAFEFEIKINGSVKHYKKGKITREAFNYIGQEHAFYVSQVIKMAQEQKNETIIASLGNYGKNLEKIDYDFSIIKNCQEVVADCNSTSETNQDALATEEIVKAEEDKPLKIKEVEKLVVNEELRRKIVSDYEKERKIKIAEKVEQQVKRNYKQGTLAYSILFGKPENIKKTDKQHNEEVEEEENMPKIDVEEKLTDVNTEVKEALGNPLKLVVRDPKADKSSIDILSDAALINENVEYEEERQKLIDDGFSEEEIEERMEAYRRDQEEDGGEIGIDHNSFDILDDNEPREV